MAVVSSKAKVTLTIGKATVSIDACEAARKKRCLVPSDLECDGKKCASCIDSIRVPERVVVEAFVDPSSFLETEASCSKFTSRIELIGPTTRHFSSSKPCAIKVLVPSATCEDPAVSKFLGKLLENGGLNPLAIGGIVVAGAAVAYFAFAAGPSTPYDRFEEASLVTRKARTTL